MPERPRDEFASRGRVELAVQGLDMIVDGVRAPIEFGRDGADRRTGDQELQDLLLSCGEERRWVDRIGAEGQYEPIDNDRHRPFQNAGQHRCIMIRFTIQTDFDDECAALGVPDRVHADQDVCAPETLPRGSSRGCGPCGVMRDG